MPNMEISKLLIRKLEEKRFIYHYVEEMILPQFSWNDVQDALIYILLDDNHKDKDYETVAEIIWETVLDGRTVEKEAVVGLLYYRLGKREAPYENNLIWSIATELYNLDYSNSEFNPLMDPNILETLSEYGITIV